MHDYKVVSSERKFSGHIMDVDVDQVTMPGGTVAGREVVRKKGAVAIVALNKADEILLLNQYRHPVRQYLWEIPAGLLDVAGEGPEVCAQRELLEETGLVADHWQNLITIAASPGFTDETTTIYLATLLRRQEDRPAYLDDEESDMTLEWVSMDKALDMIFANQIINAHTVAGIMAAKVKEAP
jgi:8-oxo-dGDP phosphatase